MTAHEQQPVDRCVCANVTFIAMKAHVEREGGDMDSLRTLFGCGARCAMCVPYVRAMLRTGRTRFSVDDTALQDPFPNDPSVPPPSL